MPKKPILCLIVKIQIPQDHTPIPTDALTQSTLQAVPPLTILFNSQPASLTSSGIQIPNSTTVIKNPA